MKNQHLVVILLAAVLVVAAAAPLCAAATLAKPNVTIPSGWELYDETAYPNAVAEHDSQGAGLLEYENTETYDYVMIYYENKPSQSYSSADLQSEVESIFYRDHTDLTLDESGVDTFAGVQAGYAKTYDATYDVYHLELVLIKGNYYMNIYAVYDATNTAENTVNSLINSISVDSGLFSGSMLYIIIGIIVVIVVVVVVLVLVMKRKKKAVAPMPAYQGNMSIPPPPPS